MNAQKNKNGTIYDKHPGIELVASFHQAYASGGLMSIFLVLFSTWEKVLLTNKTNNTIKNFFISIPKSNKQILFPFYLTKNLLYLNFEINPNTKTKRIE